MQKVLNLYARPTPTPAVTARGRGKKAAVTLRDKILGFWF
jgi:hypothetical protein